MNKYEDVPGLKPTREKVREAYDYMNYDDVTHTNTRDPQKIVMQRKMRMMQDQQYKQDPLPYHRKRKSVESLVPTGS